MTASVDVDAWESPMSDSLDVRPQWLRSMGTADARRVFQRTLGSWACDMLRLRRCGGLTPLWAPTDDVWFEAA